jgi:hypothetical protein
MGKPSLNRRQYKGVSALEARRLGKVKLGANEMDAICNSQFPRLIFQFGLMAALLPPGYHQLPFLCAWQAVLAGLAQASSKIESPFLGAIG